MTCDVTCQKRGHQSLCGVMVVASWETGQVLDIEVLSKWCKDCHAKRHLDSTSTEFLDWWEEHLGICTINYSGSPGAMEVAGAVRIWRCSVEVHKLGYTTMISDGDSSTFPTILLLSLIFTSFILLKERLTEAVPTGRSSKIFNSLMISGNMSAYPSQDSISILISCNVGGLKS